MSPTSYQAAPPRASRHRSYPGKRYCGQLLHDCAGCVPRRQGDGWLRRGAIRARRSDTASPCRRAPCRTPRARSAPAAAGSRSSAVLRSRVASESTDALQRVDRREPCASRSRALANQIERAVLAALHANTSSADAITANQTSHRATLRRIGCATRSANTSHLEVRRARRPETRPRRRAAPRCAAAGCTSRRDRCG